MSSPTLSSSAGPLAAVYRPRLGAWLALAGGGIPGMVVLLLATARVIDEDIAWMLFVPSFVGLNALHMAATWSRVYLTPGFATARPVERIAVPLLLIAVALTVEAMGGVIVLLSIQYYLSLHHGAMQNYGLVRASQRASGRELGLGSARLDQLACVLPVLAALAYRASDVCAIYDAAPMPRPPTAVIGALGCAALLAVCALVGREARDALRGEPVDALSLGISLGVTGSWVILLLGFRDPVLPFFALASGHYVQYLWVVLRSAPPRIPTRLVPLLSPLGAHGSRLALLAGVGLVGIGGVTLLAIATQALGNAAGDRLGTTLQVSPIAAAMVAVNLQHYWLDHRIWRSPGSRGAATPARVRTMDVPSLEGAQTR